MTTDTSVRNVSIVFALWMCLSFAGVQAQEGQLLFHHLKLEDGLSDLTNPYVYKDSRGFIWISSINGLNRFDGTRIRRYLPDPSDSTSIYGENIQSSFFEVDDSKLWFSTYEAVNYYDRKHDCFYHFLITNDDKKPFIGYHVFHLDASKNLWLIVDENQLYTFNTQTYNFHFVTKLQLASNRAVAVADKAGNVKMIFTYRINNDGVEKISIGPGSHVTADTVLWNTSSSSLVSPREILVEADTVLWIATKSELLRYDTRSGKVNPLRVNNLMTIEFYNDSMLLVSIDQEGIWEFHKPTFAFRYLYKPENENSRSLLTNRINYISRDRDNGLWVSSTGFGLSFAYPEKRKFELFNPLTVGDLDNSKFNLNGFHVLSSEKVICATISGGIYILDRDCQIIKKFEPADPLSLSRITSLYGIFPGSHDQIWLSSFQGLSVTSNQLERMDHVKGNAVQMLDGVELADGRILFSGYDVGLYQLMGTPTDYTLKPLKPDVFDQSYVGLQQDRLGRIWMNEELLRFLVLDPVTLSITHVVPIEGICSPFIESSDKQVIWIAASSGLYKVDSRSLDVLKVYNERNGLPSVGLSGMLMDEGGRLWFTCRLGLAVFDPLSETCMLYGHDDGIPATDFHRNATCRFDDGEMWFGSAAGITKFYPEQLNPIRTPAIPQITELLVNDKLPERSLVCEINSATNITEIQKLTFLYRENTLTFILSALEYSSPTSNRIRYKLEGVEPDWVNTKSGSEIRYPHLKAKSYTLLVQASNSDGIFNDEIRRLDFTITPPYYQTWWFKGLVFLTFMSVIIYIIYLKFSKALELQRVRLRLYENLHDDVGSRLSAIALSAKQVANEDTSGNPRLEQISKTANYIYGNLRRLIWATDPGNESINSTVQKIRYDKSSIIDDGISFHLDCPPELLPQVISGEIRYQVTSIISEALHNISKYAKADNVWIRFEKDDKILVVTVRDDGVGFEPAEVKTDKASASGYGLTNMQNRAKRIKGKVVLRSSSGNGTMIEMRVPLS